MKFSKLKLPLVIVSAVSMFAGISCRKQDFKGKSSTMLNLETEIIGPVPGGDDPKTLCSFLKEEGYFPSNSYPANTKLLFSTSYDIVTDAAGQAYGIVGADGFFEQQGNTTRQLLLCPGASSISGGKCNWKINGADGHAQLAFDVVCNARSRQGTKIHPGYSQQRASIVRYKASTAGQSKSGQDAVEVILTGRESEARIVFAKGIGLVATVFQEGLMPAGTAEVFIGGSSGGNTFGE